MQFDCDCGMATANDPPECPECGRRMKHLRLEVLGSENMVSFSSAGTPNDDQARSDGCGDARRFPGGAPDGTRTGMPFCC